MNLTQLTAAIVKIVQDSDYTSDITDMINEAITQIAAGDMIPGKFQLTPPLPDLYSVGTVTTDATTSVSLPADYHRSVIQVLNSDEEIIPIEDSYRKFINRYPEEEGGEVFRCSVNGSNLMYRDIPASPETLTVHYYKKPDVLVDGTDEPTEIPSQFHRKLIVSHVCKEIFDQIEDGLDDPQINTTKYTNIYQRALVELEIVIGFDDDPDFIDSHGDYCE